MSDLRPISNVVVVVVVGRRENELDLRLMTDVAVIRSRNSNLRPMSDVVAVVTTVQVLETSEDGELEEVRGERRVVERQGREEVGGVQAMVDGGAGVGEVGREDGDGELEEVGGERRVVEREGGEQVGRVQAVVDGGDGAGEIGGEGGRNSEGSGEL